MKVCFPIQNNEGLKSVPHMHFGNAKMFLIIDSDTLEMKVVNNGDLNHEHGKCQPIQAICGETIDSVVVGGIGQGAISKLNSMGIKVYKAAEGTVEENIEQYNNNGLQVYSAMHICNHHDCH